MGQTGKLILDTGAGPIFIRLRDFAVESQIHELLPNNPSVVGASGEGLQALGVHKSSFW